jgi:hypothetical protein
MKCSSKTKNKRDMYKNIYKLNNKIFLFFIDSL